ncbi:MAG: prepilin-type N-terminal cleavage/methylation domain-containing protein [Candidatus Magnetominusculus sp. LBB02]|nr:prepilin-type N-terminal cleavage/methylation domain-containing protein [Candidatus Magnetominusculus sp. LBB02]
MNKKLIIASDKGFSLIEVIASLVILGIIAVMGAYGIVTFTSGSVYQSINAETQQKALFAMNRMEKELIVVQSVTSASATSISFNSLKKSTTPSAHTVTLSGSTITIDGDTLVDLVSGFALSYSDTYNGTFSSTWSSTNKIIQYSITLTDGNGHATTFTNRVVPRDLS